MRDAVAGTAMSIDVVAMHPAASGRDPKEKRLGIVGTTEL